ncbi:hypothetical protein FOA52_002683 [Chlamydomonas sp. UWO 241]|nr:hypothetical protein FOA52_002683 [Chlamydomonas sp. UWO 241]
MASPLVSNAQVAAELEEEARVAIDLAWSTLMDGDMERCLSIAEFTDVLYAVLDFFTSCKEGCRIKDLWKAVEAMRGAGGGIDFPGFKAFMTESERGVRAAALAEKRHNDRREGRASSGGAHAVEKESSTAAAAAAAAPAIEEVEVSSAILCYCAAQDAPNAKELAQPPLEEELSGTRASKIEALFKRFLPTGTAAVGQTAAANQSNDDDDGLSVAALSFSMPEDSRSRYDHAFPDAAAPLPCFDDVTTDDDVSNGSPRGSESGDPGRLDRRGGLDLGHVDARGSLDTGCVHVGGPCTDRGGLEAGADSGAQLLWGGDLDALVEQQINTETGMRLDVHAAAEEASLATCHLPVRRVSFAGHSACARSVHSCTESYASSGDAHGSGFPAAGGGLLEAYGARRRSSGGGSNGGGGGGGGSSIVRTASTLDATIGERRSGLMCAGASGGGGSLLDGQPGVVAPQPAQQLKHWKSCTRPLSGSGGGGGGGGVRRRRSGTGRAGAGTIMRNREWCASSAGLSAAGESATAAAGPPGPLLSRAYSGYVEQLPGPASIPGDSGAAREALAPALTASPRRVQFSYGPAAAQLGGVATNTGRQSLDAGTLMAPRPPAHAKGSVKRSSSFSNAAEFSTSSPGAQMLPRPPAHAKGSIKRSITFSSAAEFTRSSSTAGA